MDLKSSIGICSKVEGYDKLVIIPQDPEKFNENQVIVLVAANDFESFTDEMGALIKFVRSAQTVSKDD
ncbi:MAG: hypothetical protein WAL81_10275 [Methanobacterium sp.]